MDINSINFLKDNHGKEAMKLRGSFKTTNKVLENILKELISDAQVLQEDKNYNKVADIIDIQRDVNDYIELNEEFMVHLKDERPIVSKSTVQDKQEPQGGQDLLDYDEYAVDSSIPHSLQEDFRHKRPHAFNINKNYMRISTWKDMLIKTCEYLNKLDSDIFKSFASDDSMRWGDTYNFTQDKSLLREPVLIKGSGIYIETSKDSIAVKQLVIKMLGRYELNVDDYKIYLRADYSPKYDVKGEKEEEAI